jgi:hypothetical protein
MIKEEKARMAQMAAAALDLIEGSTDEAEVGGA